MLNNFKSKNSLKLFIITYLFLNQYAFGQYTTTQVDSLINKAMTSFNVAGAAVAIVKDGKQIYSRGFGLQSVKSKKKVSSKTNFAIASNSKAFTTAALALLVEDGKITWTDKVRKHIPEFTMYNSYVAENFNIQDLLTHRSGLGLGAGDLMFFPDGADFSIDDLLASFQHLKMESAFRTKFDYDNLLYIVAGELIKRVSGMSFNAFITERIFKPLEMNDSYASIEMMKNKTMLASPHSSENPELTVLPDFDFQMNSAAGGIYSNVDDLSKWMLVHLNKGKYGTKGDKNLFSLANQREMWKIHTVMNTGRNPQYNSNFSGYGLGWFLTDIQGKMVVNHTGGLPGMLSKTVMIPDLNLGFVILTNTSDDGAYLFTAVSNSLVESYLSIPENKWVNRLESFLKNRSATGDTVSINVWKEVASKDQTKVETKKYLGVYKDPWFGKMEVYMEKGELRMRSHRSPKLNGSMHFYKGNTFAVKWDYRQMNCDAFAMFTLDENGKAIGIKMKGISPYIDFSFDFHDLDLTRVE